MTGVHIDASQVDRLALDLSDAPLRMQRKARKVMEVAANKIKRYMKEDASGHRHLPGLDGTVGYDRRDSLGLSYEIGFDKRGQGHLANIACFGSSNNAPVMDLGSSLRREAPFMIDQLGGAAEDAVFGGESE